MLMTAVWRFIIYHHTSNSMSDFVCLGHIHKMYILFIYYELMRKKSKDFHLPEWECDDLILCFTFHYFDFGFSFMSGSL